MLRQRPPSVAQLGRWAHAAAQQADALLPVLDAVARPRVAQAAADEIFFGRRPCLMVVEQHSLCWLTGRLADDRQGATWAEELRRLPNLRQVSRDGGTGLAKAVALVNQERQAQGRQALTMARVFSQGGSRSIGSSGVDQARLIYSMSATGSQRVDIAQITSSRLVGSISASTTITQRLA